MKTILSFLIVGLFSTSTFAQSEAELQNTGDNFSLEGALALLKKASSIEDFETLLNTESTNVNNLDLNNDGQTDYVSVEDIKNGNSHVLVLSTSLNESEKQDIATIHIQKTSDNEATLQIIGDDDLYAENTIAEPFETTETSVNQKGPNAPELVINQVFVNVWFWPSIQFMYAPSYILWRSPYRWHNYPRWYRPWNPFGYSQFYNRCAPHRVYYRRSLAFRFGNSRNFYAPYRHRSVVYRPNYRVRGAVYRGNRNNVRNQNFNRGGVMKPNRVRMGGGGQGHGRR